MYLFSDVVAHVVLCFRKSSAGLSRIPSLPKTHSRGNSSTDLNASSSGHDNQQSKESTPSISFSVTDGVKLDIETQSSAASEKSVELSQGGRRSSDGTESPKSVDVDPADLRGFEKSLNTILDKCSEPSVDLTLDSSRETQSVEETVTPVKSGKSVERKKKSVPWYTVGFMIFSETLIYLHVEYLHISLTCAHCR